MNKSKTLNTLTSSLLLAGLLGAAGVAQAQGISLNGVTGVAVEAGTMVQGVAGGQVATDAGAEVGVRVNTPGVTGNVDVSTGTTTEVFVPVSRKDQIRQEAHGLGKASGTLTGPKTGEASTVVKGRPNAEPNEPLATRSRAELRTEREMKKAKRRAASQISILSNQAGSVGAVGAAVDTSVGVEAGISK